MDIGKIALAVWDKSRPWAGPAVVGAAYVGVVVLPIFASLGGVSGRTRLYYILGTVVCVLINGLAGLIARSQTKQQVEAAESLAATYRAQLGVTVAAIISPVAIELGRIARARGQRRSQLQNGLVPLAMSMITQGITDVPGLRVSFYELRRPANAPAELVRRAHLHRGRADAPRLRFIDGESARSSAIHQRLATGTFDYMEDVAKVKDLELFTDKLYKTYFSVPVLADEEPYGMLCVDATEPYVLQPHRDLVVALSALLGAGLAS